MLENEAKGWHGSYSVIGRSIVERFQMLLKKDEILSGKLKKVTIRDFFTDDENKNTIKTKKNKKVKDIDIFSESFDKKKKEKTRIKIEEKKMKQADLCASIPKYDLKEKYKYHQTHHEDFNKKLMKQKEIKTLSSYNPKMDFIWKKIITGPHWKFLKGRKIRFKYNEENIKLSKSIKEKGVKNNLNNKGLMPNNIRKLDSMDKQTRRGYLPTSYDLRIRTDKAFIPKIKINQRKNKSNNTNNNSEENNDNNDKKNKNSNSSIILKEKISITPNKSKYIHTFENNNTPGYLNTYTNNFNFTQSKKLLNTDNFSRNINSNLNKINKKVLNLKKKLENKNLNFSPIKADKNILNHTIDFSKSLSRPTNVFLTQKQIQITHPFFNPSYKLIEPRSLTMVSYSKKTKGKTTPLKFEGIDPHYFFDADKVINKINNHKEVNAPNFNIMAGRYLDNGPLPSFMVKLCDRKSLEIITDKGLKMNNYANIDFQNNFSTFHPKKTFNKIINYTLFKKQKEEVEEELKKINKEIYGDNKLKKMIEKYGENDSKTKDYNDNNFDFITLKTFKRNKINSETRNKPLAYRF